MDDDLKRQSVVPTGSVVRQRLDSFFDEETLRKELKACFQHFDQGDKGFLDYKDLKCATVALLGINPSKSMLLSYFGGVSQTSFHQNEALTVPDREHKRNETSSISWGYDLKAQIKKLRVYPSGFEEAMVAKMQEREPYEDIKTAFQALDLMADGFVSELELQKIMKDVCSAVPPDVVTDIFKELDPDNDGRVSLFDFRELVLYYQRHFSQCG